MNFPAVTICNLNRMKQEFRDCTRNRFSEVGKVPSTDELSHKDKHISLYERRSLGFCSNYQKRNENKSAAKYSFLKDYISLEPHYTKSYGYQAGDLIIDCSFKGIPCYSNNFTYFKSMKYGTCFIFNKKEIDSVLLNVSSVDSNKELDITLNISSDSYANVTSVVGAQVVVHDPSEYPASEVEGFSISPGFQTTVELTQKREIRLPSPYRDH